MASEAKSKISNIHSSEVIKDIQKKIYYKVFWSNMQLLTLMNFDLRGQIWPLRPKLKNLNIYSSEAATDIQTTFFLLSSFFKYETFNRNEL